MRIYYLDTPLETQELEQLRIAVVGPSVELRQVRVLCVLPAVPEAAARADSPDGPHLHRVLRHLRNAGLGQDIGRQVGWVVPRDPRWSEAFQAAIHRLTGLHPIAIQRWCEQPDGTLARVPLCITDLHGMRDAGTASQRAP